MRVLLVQDAPDPGSPDANVARVLRALDLHPEVDLAVLPELFLSGYEAAGAVASATPAAEAVQAIAPAAARHSTAVVVGFAERLAGGQVANSVAVVSATGELAAVYRKTQLFGPTEQQAFTPGDAYVLADLTEHVVAPLICFDVEFPEPARAVAGAGAQLLVTVAANMAPYAQDHRLAARARALENRLPHLYVNRVGYEAGHTFVGGSCAIDDRGRVVAEADPGDLEGAGPVTYLVCELETGGVPDPEIDYLALRREPLPVRRDEYPV